ncbi:MAG: carboxymuconolactone decarboxylase family protein [Planctomycetota bacterium]|nr:carboxymuconolactone decarboxylase family protein [Planctomycetota bacterium]
MSRLKPVDPTTATGEAKQIFDGPLKGKHFNLFKSLANSPAALNAYLGMAGALSKGLLSAKEQETVQLAIAQQNDCDYCLAAHTALGKGAGLSVEQTIGARKGAIDDPKLDALSKFALALHEKKGWVDDADLKRIRDAGYQDGHIAEVVAVYSLATYTNFFNHLNDTPIDFPQAPALA